MLEKIIGTLLFLLTVTGAYHCADHTKEPKEYLHNEYLSPTNEYPHDVSSFTQGLFFYDGEMYESVGRYGESAIYKDIDPVTGKHGKEFRFPDNIFAEGSAVFNDKLYVLTYKEEQVMVFDPNTLEHITTYSYPRQGWGLTADKEHLIASDGSSKLYFMDEDLHTERTVSVTENGEEVDRINELEYINGEIWANVWLTERIIIIDPETGTVTRSIDFSGLYTPISDSADDVLNGIAYDKVGGKVYITGKRWNKMYEFEIR